MTDTAPDDSQSDVSKKERIPLPDSAFLTDEQLQAVEALTHGPRKGVFGPFIPLLQTPRLLNLMEPLGAELRFHGRLDDRIRELVICAVARYTSNQFEWAVHVPLAEEAGVSRATITAVLEGRIPKGIPNDEYLALEFAQRLMSVHSVPDTLFAEVKLEFGEEAIIELSTLIGYFVTVCWIMNVSRTESPGVRNAETLRPYV
jgi:4-carboxymuconolactone decarboxylase